MEVQPDIVLEILHRLPSKSLGRFKCVSKSWKHNICVYCRSPFPPVVGLFYQAPLAAGRPVNFFSTTTTTTTTTTNWNLDKSLQNLDKSLYIIASSNGFLLCTNRKSFQQMYYIYNPTTDDERQWLALPKTKTCAEFVGVGFFCNNVNFTIVRYIIPLYWLHNIQSHVTIEILSPQTNYHEWSKLILPLDIPLWIYPPKFTMRLSSASCQVVHDDGSVMLYWLDCGPQIMVYDNVNTSFWSLDLPEKEFANNTQYYLGVSSGILCHASVDYVLTVWHLKSGPRNRIAQWEKMYSQHVFNNIIIGPTTILRKLSFHPTNSHILYLHIHNNLISYHMENCSVNFVYHLGNSKTYNFFHYEAQEWPALIPNPKHI